MAEETQVCTRCHMPRPRSSFRSRRLYCDRCSNLLKRYKTTYQQVRALWEAQGGTCALCETPLELDSTQPGQADVVHVDHCHSTKGVRGLLCRHCNLLLGHAKDRVVVLEAAIRYLRKNASSEQEDLDGEISGQ
jgi:hypothetical protein